MDSALPAAVSARLHLQLATLERAGIAPLQALAMLELPASEQGRARQAKQLLEAGQPLALAGRLAGLFTPLEAAVIAAACVGGSPALAHQRLGERANTRAAQAKALRSRLLLPAFVLLLALLVMPLPALVAGSLSPVWYLGRIVLLGAAAAGLFHLGRELYRRQQAAEDWPLRAELEGVLLSLPLLGPLTVRTQAQRFFENLGLLLECGLPAVDAVRWAASTLRIQRIREDFESALPALAAGSSLHAVAESWRYLGDRTVLGTLATGEGSGRVPELLQRYAAQEATQVSDRVEALATWLPRLLYAALALGLAWSMISGFASLLRRTIE